jgi:hypothetical protein
LTLGETGSIIGRLFSEEFASRNAVSGGKPFSVQRGHRPAFHFSRVGFELE